MFVLHLKNNLFLSLNTECNGVECDGMDFQGLCTPQPSIDIWMNLLQENIFPCKDENSFQ